MTENKIIDYFVTKYNFIQQKDIELIENSEFDTRNYNKIHGKPFICINPLSSSSIEFGTIFILIDKYDEDDEYYTIDKNILFECNLGETSLEEIIQKCKLFNLI
jgi:hypothetical protein